MNIPDLAGNLDLLKSGSSSLLSASLDRHSISEYSASESISTVPGGSHDGTDSEVSLISLHDDQVSSVMRENLGIA